jgi:hypothetical protein
VVSELLLKWTPLGRLALQQLGERTRYTEGQLTFGADEVLPNHYCIHQGIGAI